MVDSPVAVDAAHLLAVAVMFEPLPRIGSARGPTSIDKRAVDGPVGVDAVGVHGDRVYDTKHHGGPDKAVYAYAQEDADGWAAELDRELPPGYFGENLRTAGLDVTGAVIGETWQVGDGPAPVLLEVTMPRTPCQTFARRMDEPHWVRRFTARGRPGAYLRVRRGGSVRAGDPVVVVDRPAHGVGIGAWFTGRRPADARAVLAAEAAGTLAVAADLRPYLDAAVARARC